MRKAACLLFLCTDVAAQVVPLGDPPTGGVYNPTLGVAGEGDASAVERNPALLGTLRSWSGVYLHSELGGSGVVGGRGDGFFFATPLPYLDFLSLGAGLQLVRPPERFPFGNLEKLSLAAAWRPYASLSIGLTYAHVFSGGAPIAPGIDTFDLGAAWRGRYAAIGLVVHDVPGPLVAGLRLQRVYEPELAVRPLGRDTLEIAASLRAGERRGDVDPRFRVWVTPLRGVVLKAELEWRRDLNLDGALENDLRLSMGLELHFAHIGFAGFGLWGRDEGAVLGHGFALAARVSGERYPSVWSGPHHFEKIVLSDKLDERSLAKLLLHLHQLEHDRSVDGVLVALGDFSRGWAIAEELRGALLRLRKSGRHVFAYVSETGSKGYYVAASAERIFLDPAGGIQLRGLSKTQVFFKGTGDLLGIRADFVKIAEYKSWPEQLTRSSSSAEARTQRDDLLDDVYGHLVDGIAAGRKVSAEVARTLIDAGPYAAGEALHKKVIDELRSADELEDAMGDTVGHPVLLREPSKAPARPRSWQPAQVALIFVDGEIVDGKSQTIPLLDQRLSGLQTLLPVIEAARDDSRVRAVVLRINSPGGSALASDLLARAIERTQAVKPVVCSFGDVAASGGYYLAAPCGRIFAEPSTISGSIGIFAGKIDLSGLLSKLGISFELTDRGKHASMHSWFRLYSEEERANLLQDLRYHYDRFVAQVSRGRHLSEAAVDAVGRGHVFSGSRAQTHKLVDEMGSLSDAVDYAGRMAHIAPEDRTVVALPPEPSLLSQLLSLLGFETKSDLSLLQPLIRQAFGALPISVVLAPSAPQARLDAHLIIH